jgi:hypothetical protein
MRRSITAGPRWPRLRDRANSLEGELLPRVEVVRVEAPRTMWRIMLAPAAVGPKIMVDRTVEAMVRPVARVTARLVVGTLTRIR